jgi:porphobilinogen synthase
MPFPQTRLRRLRATRALRGLVRETCLAPADFIYPMFVAHGIDRREPIAAMPGIDRLSIAHAVAEAGEALALGIPAVLLFGIPAAKDEEGSGAWDDEGIVQLATRAIKQAHPELLVIADLCLCEYTSHGHCGVIRQPDDSRAGSGEAGCRAGRKAERGRAGGEQPDDSRAAGSSEAGCRAGGRREGIVDNDATLELLARTAVSQARAGADMIAPSDMMDGRVGAIRAALDDDGLSDTPIMAYSAKFASAFYGPFREAADSTPSFGDRRAYQMDPANAQEAVREARLDVEEGADILIVKPALPYLDVIRRVKEDTGMPLAAYNVSGEYSMLKAAVAAGYLDERAAVLESLTSIRRAGADIVITYHAKEAARWLQ